MATQRDIGQRIQARRKFLGLTQPDVANKMNLKRQTYGNYETGVNEMTAAQLSRIAVILKCSVAYLLDQEEPNAISSYYSRLPPEAQTMVNEVVRVAYNAYNNKQTNDLQTADSEG